MNKILDKLEKDMRDEAKECDIDIENQPEQDWNEGFYYGVIRGIQMIRSELNNK